MLALTVFALHPLQAEPVAYIYARTTLLCGLFSWIAIAAWLRDRSWIAVLCTALALLAKEEAVALPVFFALLYLTQSRPKIQLAPLAATFLLALATGLRGLAATAQIKGSGAGFDVATSPFQYALAQGQVIVRYLRLLVIPLGLNFDPDIAVVPWLALLCWAVILAALVALYKSNPKAAFWFAAGLIFLAPTSSILPIADLAADRRMYLAGPCFAACLGLLLPALKRHHVTGIAVLLAGLTLSRALTFSDPASLWRQALAGSPNKPRPRIQLARALPPAEALSVLGADPAAASERGRVYLDLARPADALREFGTALAGDPGDPRALTNRGTALAALNQIPAAQQDFLRALAADPCLYPALLNLHLLGLPLPNTAHCRFTPQQQMRLNLK